MSCPPQVFVEFSVDGDFNVSGYKDSTVVLVYDLKVRESTLPPQQYVEDTYQKQQTNKKAIGPRQHADIQQQKSFFFRLLFPIFCTSCEFRRQGGGLAGLVACIYPCRVSL